MNADPFDVEAQKKIEEAIRQVCNLIYNSSNMMDDSCASLPIFIFVIGM